MTASVLDADLDVELDLPGRGVAHASLRGRGNRLVMQVDRPDVFAGQGDAPAVRAVAEALADRGVVVRVEHGSTHLITIGDTRVPWWQRRATGSRHIRLGSLRGAWTSGRARLGAGADPVLPDGTLLPPETMWPLAPTFARRPRRRVTTTHDPARGGHPRLVVVDRDRYLPGEQQRVFWLEEDMVSIGGTPDSDIVLAGLEPLHAEVVHDEADEFVVRARGGVVRVGGAPVESQVLRSGARVQVGRWTLAFGREEYADHGRPYGGRIGGELGRQRTQPPRPGRQRDEWSPS